MGQWIELELRKEQLDLILDCLESECLRSDDYFDIERCVHLIDDLQEQEIDYKRKLYARSDIKQ